MRRCTHTGLSTRFRLSHECERCRAEDAARTSALLVLLNPLRWFRRRVTSWPRPISRAPSLAQVRDGGVGVLEAQGTPSLIDVTSIADLMRYHQRTNLPGLLVRMRTQAAKPRPLGGYADTIRK